MRTVYVTDHGLHLKKKSNRILVKRERKTVEEIPLLDLKRILIFGNSQLSTVLMRELARKGIEVAFLSSGGRFNVRLVPETSKNIYLRMAQHEKYRDSSFRLRWSKTLVRAKLKNQRSLLVRYQRNRPEIDLSASVALLKESIDTLGEKHSIEEVMGVEGSGSRVYFEAFGKLLLGEFRFSKRQYHPPPDPVNALLSFGYIVFLSELAGLLEACGFDVFLGFFHSTKYGRASLATDMIEEFRAPVIDRLVLYLINQGVLRPDQFTLEAKRGVRISDAARRAFLHNYERFVTTPFVDVKSRERKNYRQIARRKVLELERTLLKNAEYIPYTLYS